MASIDDVFKTNPQISLTHLPLAPAHLSLTEGQNMQQRHLERIIQNIRESIRDLNLQEGDFITSSDENHRISVSHYRITMEIRFPEGMNNGRE
jgi:hypothetical protein